MSFLSCIKNSKLHTKSRLRFEKIFFLCLRRRRKVRMNRIVLTIFLSTVSLASGLDADWFVGVRIFFYHTLHTLFPQWLLHRNETDQAASSLCVGRTRRIHVSGGQTVFKMQRKPENVCLMIVSFFMGVMNNVGGWLEPFRMMVLQDAGHSCNNNWNSQGTWYVFFLSTPLTLHTTIPPKSGHGTRQTILTWTRHIWDWSSS